MTDSAPAETVPAIYGAICELMSNVQSIAKNHTSEHGKFQFRGIDDVLNAVGAPMRELCIFAVPRLLTTTRTPTTSKSGGGLMNTVVEVEFDFIAGADGSKLTVGPIPGEAMDSGDKSTAKAMSVAYRIALIQLLAIPTGDRDPDHDVYERADTPAHRGRADEHDPWADSNPDLVKYYKGAIDGTGTEDGLKVVWAEIVKDVKAAKLAATDGTTLKSAMSERIADLRRGQQDSAAETPQDR